MNDAQDTIELPVFGLTLLHTGEGWYHTPYDVCAYLHTRGMFATASVMRPSGVRVAYSVYAEDPCAALLAQMTPDDVAAIRALGER